MHRASACGRSGEKEKEAENGPNMYLIAPGGSMATYVPPSLSIYSNLLIGNLDKWQSIGKIIACKYG
jgi:hypothetical protein